MSEKNIYPADNVDKDGVAYPTVGENIRNGKNSASLDFTSSDDVNNWMFDTLSEDERMSFPIFPFSKGKWVDVVDTITNGKHEVTEAIDSSSQYVIFSNQYKFAIVTYSDVTVYTKASISQGTTNFRGEQCLFIHFLSSVNEGENGKVLKIKLFKTEE